MFNQMNRLVSRANTAKVRTFVLETKVYKNSAF